ncbi:MAG: hypothetical protein H7839_00940 [Magnetococcus sp. YQC-5]
MDTGYQYTVPLINFGTPNADRFKSIGVPLSSIGVGSILHNTDTISNTPVVLAAIQPNGNAVQNAPVLVGTKQSSGVGVPQSTIGVLVRSVISAVGIGGSGPAIPVEPQAIQYWSG